MIDLSNVKLEKITMHQVGSKINEEKLILSEQEIFVGTEDEKYLLSYLLKPFKDGKKYHFSDGDGGKNFTYNEMYQLCESIFENTEERFQVQSQEVAKHLYRSQTHPRIKGGDLYVAYLKDCIVDGGVVDAIGLFKTEKKEVVLQTKHVSDSFSVTNATGAPIKRLDKGCLIIKAEKEKGYKIVVKEETRKAIEALYFKEAFLKLRPREDSYYYTELHLKFSQRFIEDIFNEDHGVDRCDQIDLQKRIIKYFGEREYFNAIEFEHEVLEEPAVISAWMDGMESFEETYEVMLKPEFTINPTAVKRSIKDFKSEIKLDGNKIKITVNGNQHNLEHGYDHEKGLKYYICYYEEEA
ncbi:nucleoid-associated protein [Algivirga pacifica]|uniref:Nucleoid-associated protein n=1 Tax=Algivirga pacifica TaxID=1162670 RepID=A0ABP9D2H6_9BACT